MCTCALRDREVARLLQPHCDDNIDCKIIEKHTTAMYGENPGNRHPNPNNSASLWQLMALLPTERKMAAFSF